MTTPTISFITDVKLPLIMESSNPDDYTYSQLEYIENAHGHYQTTPPHFKKARKTPFNGLSGEYQATHKTPQCRKCGQEIQEYDVERKDRTMIDGFYTEYHVHMHFTCYDELQEKLRYMLISKEADIISDVEQAILDDKVITHQYYDLFHAESYKYCIYCEGLLTDLLFGVSYPSTNVKRRDFYGLVYIHANCYNHIRKKPQYNVIKSQPVLVASVDDLKKEKTLRQGLRKFLDEKRVIDNDDEYGIETDADEQKELVNSILSKKKKRSETDFPL